MRLAELTVHTRDGIVYATISGDIDMSNVHGFRSDLSRAVTNQAVGLVLDLAAVEYLDSAGIQLVHSLQTSLRTHGQQLALIIPSESVINDALRLAGLDWTDVRIENQDEAAEAFEAGRGAT